MVFATLPELQARCEWDFDSGEERIAQGALEDLTADALYHGNPRWTDLTVPPYVKTLVLKAAQRYMRNPDGYEQSRAGDETVAWGQRSDQEAGSASFNEKELAAIRALVRPRVFGSVNVQAYGTRLGRSQTGYVPVADGSKPFPYYASQDGPW